MTEARARARAAEIDARVAAGHEVGPLAGVPFAVKNLIDVAGLPTRAGSKINRAHAPALRDATLVRRLEEAGAILVGTLNMGEYAYDFTGENIHDGNSLNPHNLGHMSGGSSGGCGSALAAGLVPLALGSDTNGSIRVPSAFCGLFGLKPTYGRLSRAGSFPFVASLDHLGPMARAVKDLALAYDAMQGEDRDDPHLAARPIEPSVPRLETAPNDLRIATATGYFEDLADDDARRAVAIVAEALGAKGRVALPEVARARAAAFVLTASEAASFHLERLRRQPGDFDPAVRDRLVAGATLPGVVVEKAQRLRRWFRDEVLKLFTSVDIILAPSTPFRAPRSGQATIRIAGEEVATRPNIGVFTQPISFIGLPVAAVPIWIDQGLPLGVQIIAPPWRETDALRVAFALEAAGIARAPVAGQTYA